MSFRSKLEEKKASSLLRLKERGLLVDFLYEQATFLLIEAYKEPGTGFSYRKTEYTPDFILLYKDPVPLCSKIEDLIPHLKSPSAVVIPAEAKYFIVLEVKGFSNKFMNKTLTQLKVKLMHQKYGIRVTTTTK